MKVTIKPKQAYDMLLDKEREMAAASDAKASVAAPKDGDANA